MSDFPSYDPEKQDLLAYLRRVLQIHLENLESGDLPLRVPRLKDRMRQTKGTHFHLYPELFIQISGTSLQHMPAEHLRLRPGQLLIMPRGVPHLEEALAGKRQPFCNLVLMYPPGEFAFHLATSAGGYSPFQLRGMRFESPDVRRIASYLDDAAEWHWTRSHARKSGIRGLLAAHFCSLLTLFDEVRPVRRQEHTKIRRCKELITTNLTDPALSVQLLARWIHCSPDYLSHLFHQETGRSLKEFITAQRMAFAKELLGDAALNITEIATATGFSDPSYFSRLFRKITGVSPSQYRNGLTPAV